MEVVLEEFKAGYYPNLKQDLAKRKLTKGVLIYESKAKLGYNVDNCELIVLANRFLLPLHGLLQGNEDYEGGNIVLFIYDEEPKKPFKKESVAKFGVMFNKINDWDALPDDMWFKHGRNKLVVKNITKG